MMFNKKFKNADMSKCQIVHNDRKKSYCIRLKDEFVEEFRQMCARHNKTEVGKHFGVSIKTVTLWAEIYEAEFDMETQRRLTNERSLKARANLCY